MKKQHILIQYKDESYQWIQNTTEAEVSNIKNFKRVVSFCNNNFSVDTKRWRVGRSQFEKIIVF